MAQRKKKQPVSTGRPRKPFNFNQLDQLIALGLPQEQCAAIMCVHLNTVLRRIKEKHDLTFTEYQRLKEAPLHQKVTEKIFDKALEEGDGRMLALIAKSKLGWSETKKLESKNEHTHAFAPVILPENGHE